MEGLKNLTYFYSYIDFCEKNDRKGIFLKICLNWFYIKIKFIKEGGDNKSGVFFLLVTAFMRSS